MNPTWFRRLCHLVALAAEAALGDPDNPIPTAHAWPETSCSEPLPGPHDFRAAGTHGGAS